MPVVARSRRGQASMYGRLQAAAGVAQVRLYARAALPLSAVTTTTEASGAERRDPCRWPIDVVTLPGREIGSAAGAALATAGRRGPAVAALRHFLLAVGPMWRCSPEVGER